MQEEEQADLSAAKDRYPKFQQWVLGRQDQKEENSNMETCRWLGEKEEVIWEVSQEEIAGEDGQTAEDG